MSCGKFNFTSEDYIVDLIRTDEFIQVPEGECYIDVASTYKSSNDEFFVLSYSGKLYRFVLKSSTKSLNDFTIDGTKNYPTCWRVTNTENSIVFNPYGPATFNYDGLIDTVDKYYNHHYQYNKHIKTQTDIPSINPFSQKQKSHIGVFVSVRS